jgi:hypothetical protein
MRKLGYLTMFWLSAMMPSAVLGAPPTREDSGQKFRFLSLAEARALALEHGSFRQPSVAYPGVGVGDLTAPPSGKSAERVQFVGKPGSKSIVLIGIPRDPRPADLERTANQILLNVETAYWNLYGAYWQLFSREQGLRLAYETWKAAEAHFKKGSLNRAAVDQAKEQFNLFRSQRLQALHTVGEDEKQLRAIVGMTEEDGTRLAPSDAPTIEKNKVDWKEGWYKAMRNRPELYLARKDFEEAKINLSIVEEIDLPLERAFGREKCEKSEQGKPDEDKAIFTVSDAREGPKVDPNAPSCLRKAQLRLARASLVLQDQELKTERHLGLMYRRTSSSYTQIKLAKEQREAFAEQMKKRAETFRADADNSDAASSAALKLLLEAQRSWADALATECQGIVAYNISQCGWKFVTGEIMTYAHIRLVDKADCIENAVRATKREQNRTLRNIRRESAVQTESPLNVLDCDNSAAPSLAALWKKFPPFKRVDLQTGMAENKLSDVFPKH